MNSHSSYEFCHMMKCKGSKWAQILRYLIRYHNRTSLIKTMNFGFQPEEMYTGITVNLPFLWWCPYQSVLVCALMQLFYSPDSVHNTVLQRVPVPTAPTQLWFQLNPTGQQVFLCKKDSKTSFSYAKHSRFLGKLWNPNYTTQLMVIILAF